MRASGDDGSILQVGELTVAAGGRAILGGVQFSVKRGEVLSIIGPSGCGKSSLMRYLVGLDVPPTGWVRFEGQTVVHAGQAGPPAASPWRARLGAMFQRGALWSSMTVLENLLFPMRHLAAASEREHRSRAMALLERVGVAHAADQMPQTLSGGMRKRVALARALALEPALVVLDEPGSGLDPWAVAELDALITDLPRRHGVTVVLISHDMPSVMRVSDRALYLDPVSRGAIGLDHPARLLVEGPDPVRRFMAAGLARSHGPVPVPTAGQ